MLVYLRGFASGPTSRKACLFRERFADAGLELLVPALDEGDFEHLTLTRQRRLLERLFADAPRPHVLIGSSLGGYLAALHASDRGSSVSSGGGGTSLARSTASTSE